jgi:hypothetical protein
MGESENIKAKNLGSPDEPHTFEHGKMEIASIDDFLLGG